MSAGLFEAADTPLPFTRDDKRRALDREIAMRMRVYPDWVARGRMTQTLADREIAIMQAIRQDYEGDKP